MTTLNGYDNWKLSYPAHYDTDAEVDFCVVCSEPHNGDEGIFCNCHCSDCGEELPETDDSHCQNCCECDACTEAYEVIEKHHEATGEWLDDPVITGEKVYSN